MRFFDAHFHIIDPRFPLTPNQGFLPEPFPVEAYRKRLGNLFPSGGAVVAASFQGFDPAPITEAIRQLGPAFVGVVQLDPITPDREIIQLHEAGIRAIRFNLHRGPPLPPQELVNLAERVHYLAGWHAEFYLDSADLPELAPALRQLPAYCIDHLGLRSAGFETLRSLVAEGARVKASGFGRVTLPLGETMRTLHAANPDALLFGTDLPGTRARRAFDRSDLDFLAEQFAPADLDRILRTNAQRFYGLAASASSGPDLS